MYIENYINSNIWWKPTRCLIKILYSMAITQKPKMARVHLWCTPKWKLINISINLVISKLRVRVGLEQILWNQFIRIQREGWKLKNNFNFLSSISEGSNFWLSDLWLNEKLNGSDDNAVRQVYDYISQRDNDSQFYTMATQFSNSMGSVAVEECTDLSHM